MIKRTLAWLIFCMIQICYSDVSLAKDCETKYYINPQTTYPNNEAKIGVPVQIKKANNILQDAAYIDLKGKTESSLTEYSKEYCLASILVIKNDEIKLEKYYKGDQDATYFSASMSKSVLALLYGIAIKEGLIKLDDKVSDVMPYFDKSSFGKATVEQLLRMSSGVHLVNSYDDQIEGDNKITNPMQSPQQNMEAYFLSKTDLNTMPGKRFDYNGVNTALLGLMLSKRTGISNTEYLQNKIWRKIGAEHSAYWLKNRRGQEGVQGMFSATLRDYGRLGLLVLHKGKFNGREIIPEEWIEQMTKLDRSKPQPDKPPFFYGLHIWIPTRGDMPASGRSEMQGVGGRFISIDPVANMVIVHIGHSKKAQGEFPNWGSLKRGLTDGFNK